MFAGISDIQEKQDSKTGQKIYRVSNPERRSEGVYFERQAFTADEKYFVYHEEDDGFSQLIRLTLQNGEKTIIGDRVPVKETSTEEKLSFSVTPSSRHISRVRGKRINLINIETGNEKVLLDLETHPCQGLVTYSMDDTENFIALNLDHGDRGELAVYEINKKELSSLCFIEDGISHPMICPTEPNLVTLVKHGNHCWNMEAPQNERTRTWIFDRNKNSLQPLITPQKWRTVTHESWSSDGERVFFFDKNYCEWTPVSICSVNREGKDWQVHYTTYEYFLGHGITSPCGRYFIADCQKKGDSPIVLIDLQTGKSQVVCWPNASQDGGHDAGAHVHVSFSPSGKMICYTTDVSGIPQVYISDISSLIDLLLFISPDRSKF